MLRFKKPKDNFFVPPPVKQETDPIENYHGKWAICYVLDNGSTFLNSKCNFKNTEQEILEAIEVMRQKTEYSKLQFPLQQTLSCTDEELHL